MKIRFAVVPLAAALVATPPTTSSPAAPPLATVKAAAGWVTRPAGPDNPSLVIAVTAPDVRVLDPFALFASFKRLSRTGIIVWVDTLGRDRTGFPHRSVWPPHLIGFRIEHGWEGQPSANIEQRVWVGAVRGWDLDVRVFFATQHPSHALLVKTRAELRRLRLP